MQLALLDRSKLKSGSHSTSSDVTVPSKVICFEKMNVHSVACGENHSLAVIGEEKNMLWAWGMYKNGQLGLGEVTMKMNPRPVQTLCSSQIHSIAAGSMHSAALLGDQ
jgi:alpha-tubulin suppressor-like RCC1 family protein